MPNGVKCYVYSHIFTEGNYSHCTAPRRTRWLLELKTVSKVNTKSVQNLADRLEANWTQSESKLGKNGRALA